MDRRGGSFFDTRIEVFSSRGQTKGIHDHFGSYYSKIHNVGRLHVVKDMWIRLWGHLYNMLYPKWLIGALQSLGSDWSIIL